MVAVSDKTWWVHKSIVGIKRDGVFGGLDLAIDVCFEDVVDSIGWCVEKAKEG